MHLHIFWDVKTGKLFFYWAQCLGWAAATGICTTTMAATGISFRFGDVCHVNADHSLATFWGPLLAIVGAATFLQLLTFTYCIKVFLQSIWSDDTIVNTRSPRALYRRMCKVVLLLWREVVIVAIVLVDIIFFSLVFIRLNSMSTRATNEPDLMTPFLLCLIENPVDHGRCTELAERFSVHTPIVLAVLLVLSSIGLPVFLLLLRASIFKAWADLFKCLMKCRCGKDRKFVSLGAHETEGPDQSAKLEMELL